MKKRILVLIMILGASNMFAQEEVFTIVEEMPVFPSCEKGETTAQKQECSNEKIFEFIKENAKYPASAKKAKFSGTVYVSYVVSSEGNVEQVNLIRGISNAPALDSTAIATIKKLPKMIPGKQRGKTVAVRYNIPVRFELEDK